MPDVPESGEDVDYAERIASNADVLSNAWEQALEEMELLAEQRREEGWEAVTVMAANTAPRNRRAGDDDDNRFGLVFVVPSNMGEDFSEAFEGKEFPQYEVYRREMNGNVFLVVEYMDPETETAIYIGSQYELRHAAGMVHDAEEEGEFYTYVQTLPGDILGVFKHDSHEKFVPHAERIDDWSPPAPGPGDVEQN
ncbi:DUF7529 family protein [Haloarchaeobius amylolyticus]|uniref:DUF7529 family protein n=1 Tax=Haloarchaeobius amylolyticus TaxID=1198296 RepID=UPI002270F6AC|nr:hypothetical protein [Haloarchaeobius amylolyticus]